MEHSKRPTEFGQEVGVEIQGNVFKVTVLGAKKGRKQGRRKPATSYTAKAAKAHYESLLRVHWPLVKACYLLTLTYPGTWWPDPWGAKRDLRTFWKRLRRRGLRCGAHWKMEAQDRGAPHFHLLVYGRLPLAAVELREEWRACIGASADEFMLVPDVTLVRSDAAVSGYMSKVQRYAAKTTQAEFRPAEGVVVSEGQTLLDNVPNLTEGERWKFPGGYWGKLSSEDIPWAECHTQTMGEGDRHYRAPWVKELRRVARRRYGKMRRKVGAGKRRRMTAAAALKGKRLWRGPFRSADCGFTVYAGDVVKWLDLALFFAGVEGRPPGIGFGGWARLMESRGDLTNVDLAA